MENTPTKQDKVSFWQTVKIVLGTTMAIFIIVLIFQNWYTISLNLVFKTFDTPLSLIIAISIMTGYLWGSFAAYRSNKRKKALENKTNE
ncbi:MAG TPA: LapA family protein [Taishania sp.]|nr:LapA family protein [Taishania sp.]